LRSDICEWRHITHGVSSAVLLPAITGLQLTLAYRIPTLTDVRLTCATLFLTYAMLFLTYATLTLGSAMLTLGSARLTLGSARLIPRSARLIPRSARLIPGSTLLIPGSALLIAGSTYVAPDPQTRILDHTRAILTLAAPDLPPATLRS